MSFKATDWKPRLIEKLLKACGRAAHSVGLCVGVWLVSIALFPNCQLAIAQLPLDSANSQSSVAPTKASDVRATPNATQVQPSTSGVTTESVTARLEAAQRDAELDASLKESLVGLHQRTLADLKAVGESQRMRKEFSNRIAAAPSELATAKRKQEEAPRRETAIQILDYFSIDEPQGELLETQTRLAAATDLRTRLSEQTDVREKRRKDLPQLITDARTKLEQLDKEIAASQAVQIENALFKEATAWSLATQRAAVAEQIQAYELEQRAYEAETELLPLQLELAKSEEKYLQEQVRKLTEVLDVMKQNRIIQQRQDVQKLVSTTPKSLEQIGQGLLDRTVQWLELAEKKSVVKADLDSSKSLLDKWKDRYNKMVNRVEPQVGQGVVAGFNSWVGLILRKQRSELPDPLRLSSQIRHYQQEMQNADSRQFELEDALLQISSWNDDRSSSSADSGSRLATLASMDGESRQALEQLLAKERELINGIKVDVDSYLNDLYQVADIKEQTRTLVSDYRAFIDKHVLWIRSMDQLQHDDVKAAIEAFRWLAEYKNWKQLAELAWIDIQQEPWWYVALLCAMIASVANQVRMRRVLGELGKKAIKSSTTSFRFSAEALLLTGLIVIPVLGLLLFFYWRLSKFGDPEHEFANSLGQGLLVAAVVFAPLEFLRQVCRPGGLGVSHFEWPEFTTQLISGNLRWLIDLGVPMVAIIAVMDAQSNTRWEASLGRLAFLLVMMLLVVCFARIFRPKRGIFGHHLAENPGGWLDRLRYGWYPLIVLGPLALATISFIGFHYTAERLALHLNTSLWTLVGLVLLYSLLRRWFLLSRRQIMIARAKQRLAEAAKREPSQSTVIQPEDLEVNLVDINDQTMRLLASSMIVAGLVILGVIWFEVLPAISMLERFKLWDVPGSRPDERVSITLSNVLFVIPIVVLTVIAGRNFPGLMEIALLQHLPLTGAARYAITTLSRYAIIFIGIIAVSNTIGLQWQSIQWLVAALGVGLGFGLQEIFANFVSGIILLFEQPLRVGDVITLDGVTGSVARIRMRATTIVNWDRQELIIPNKDLITGKLLNWTLSDTTNRVVVNLGIAYGSDPELACTILRGICRQHTNVLSDPEPTVVFEGFGDSSLTITVRAFLANLDVRLQTLHELHSQFYQAFREAGIELSFPQRDLHIRSLPPGLLDWIKTSAQARA